MPKPVIGMPSVVFDDLTHIDLEFQNEIDIDL